MIQLKPVLRLLLVVFLLIVLPALLFGVLQRWQVLFLAVGYLLFFLGTVWREMRFGKLSDRSSDKQVQRSSGRLAGIIAISGLISVHWLALYEFSARVDGVSMPLTTVSMTMISAAIVLSQVAIRTLGRFFDRLTIQSDHHLVTDGVYGWIRHPIYTSYLLLFAGYCLLLHGGWSFAALIAVSLIWFSSRISLEEEMLSEQFGDAYGRYRARTKRLVPFVY